MKSTKQIMLVRNLKTIRELFPAALAMFITTLAGGYIANTQGEKTIALILGSLTICVLFVSFFHSKFSLFEDTYASRSDIAKYENRPTKLDVGYDVVRNNLGIAFASIAIFFLLPLMDGVKENISIPILITSLISVSTILELTPQRVAELMQATDEGKLGEEARSFVKDAVFFTPLLIFIYASISWFVVSMGVDQLGIYFSRLIN